MIHCETTVQLRPADAADGAVLVEMCLYAVNWDPARAPLTPDQLLSTPELAHYVSWWPREGDLGCIAVGDQSGIGAPVGAAWLRLFPARDPGYGFVAADVPELSIGVCPEWRRSGVGGALLEDVCQRAADAGVMGVSLSVERANPAARLYARHGFQVVRSDRDSDVMLRRPAGLV